MRFDITTSDNVLCLKKAGTNEILELINGALFLKKHRYDNNKLLVSRDAKLDTEHDALISIECNRIAMINGANFSGNANDLMILLKPLLQSFKIGGGNGERVTEIEQSLINKVDKVQGETLTPEKYTKAEKDKLRDLANTVLNNTLTSTSTTEGLTANQGRVLKGLIDATNQLLTSDDTSLDELQEIVTYIKQNKSTLNTLSISNIAGLSDALSNLTTVITTAETNAKNHAKALDDAMVIGGRNLFLREAYRYWGSDNNVASLISTNKDSLKFQANNPNGYIWNYISYTSGELSKKLIAGEKYTISLSVKSPSSLNFVLGVNNVVQTSKLLQANEPTDFQLTFTPDDVDRFLLILKVSRPNIVVDVSEIKLEKGTKTTDYTVPPEDVQAEIDKKSIKIYDEAGNLKHTYSDNKLKIGRGVECVNGVFQLKEIWGWKELPNLTVFNHNNDCHGYFGANTANGAIAITVPTGFQKTMVTLDFLITNYETGKTAEISLITYFYVYGKVFSFPNTYLNRKGDLTYSPKIRLGYDSTDKKPIIYIGDMSDSGSFKQISLVRGVLKNANFARSQWQNGWQIGLESQAFKNVKYTSN